MAALRAQEMAVAHAQISPCVLNHLWQGGYGVLASFSLSGFDDKIALLDVGARLAGTRNKKKVTV
jgi:hypothetical protein